MKFKVNNEKPVFSAENKGFLAHMASKGIIGIEGFDRTSLPRYVSQNASPAITTPNLNLPLGALVYIKPKAVEILTAPRVADKLAMSQQNGKFGETAVNIKVREYKTAVSPDTGLADGGTKSEVNYQNVLRGVYYFRADWNTNDREEATFGGMLENARTDKVNASMLSINIASNNYFFNGVSWKGQTAPVYGLLNDPNLLPYQTVVGGTWATKTPEAIYNDIVAAFNRLNLQANGIPMNEGGRLTLGIAVGSIGQLDRTNSYGLSVYQKLKEAYPRLEIVAVPQFTQADSNSDVFYLVYHSSMDATVIDSFVEKARAYPIFQRSSETSQKISSAVSGAIVQYPMFVVRYNGIG